MNKKILIIDIETTGFLGKGHIVEIGMVELDLKNNTITELFDETCKEVGITKEECDNAWITKNSTLTTDIIMNSPDLSEMKDEIQSIINNYPNGCTAYNNNFDFGFLESRGFHFPKKLDDPMKLLTNVLKLPRKNGGYKYPSVTESMKYYINDKNYVEEHRGIEDAFDEALIVHKLYKNGLFKI